MSRLALALALLTFLLVPSLSEAQRNAAYYGTRPGMSARAYSGEYQATQPNVVPTFSLPVYGGGYRTYYRGGFGGYYPGYGAGYYGGGGYYGGYPVYQQPVIIYPPVVRYGF